MAHAWFIMMSGLIKPFKTNTLKFTEHGDWIDKAHASNAGDLEFGSQLSQTNDL